MDEDLKVVRWVGSSQKDSRTFPLEVRLDVGFALYAAGSRRTPLEREPEMTMKTAGKTLKADDVLKGSGNVFADLGLPHAEQELTKAQLTFQIARIIKDRSLTQVEAAKILGIQQPHVSALVRNRAGNFSVGRLIDFLTALGQDVDITVTPTRKEHGATSIIFA